MLDSAANTCHSERSEESCPAPDRTPIPPNEATGRRTDQSEIPRCARNDRRLSGSTGLNRRILTSTLLAVLLFLLAAPAHNLHAQTWNSHLEGMVLDPSGAAVPAASLELRNPATGLVRRADTGANGFYSFPLLPVGNYELEIAKAGFVSKVIHPLALRVGETTRVDVRLEIAHERSEIQVEARPPLIEAASPAIGDEIENRRVSLLPLNGRQFSQLALLAAGAAPPYPNSSDAAIQHRGAGAGFLGERATRRAEQLLTRRRHADGAFCLQPHGEPFRRRHPRVPRRRGLLRGRTGHYFGRAG